MIVQLLRVRGSWLTETSYSMWRGLSRERRKKRRQLTLAATGRYGRSVYWYWNMGHGRMGHGLRENNLTYHLDPAGKSYGRKDSHSQSGTRYREQLKPVHS